MRMIAYLLITTFIMMVIIIGFTFNTTIIEIHTLGNRVEDSLIASGWAGFSKIDLNKLAKRKNMADPEQRDIYLDKNAAREVVLEYIRKNLNLVSTMFPASDSYIPDTGYPVIISEITVYNPDDLPAVCSKGISFNRTTIHMVVSIPVNVKWVGFRYLQKHVDVDTKSFFKPTER